VSEVTLGQYGAAREFVIHTKAPALSRGSLSRQSILDGMEKSLRDLGVDAVRALTVFVFGFFADGDNARLSCIIFISQTLRLRLRKACLRSKTCMQPGSSSVYVLFFSYRAAVPTESGEANRLKRRPRYSSVSQTTCRRTFRKSTTSKRLQSQSSPRCIRATTMPSRVTQKMTFFRCFAS